MVANGLRSPRGILFDEEGALLVVEQEHGISRLTLTGDGPCVRQDGDTQVVIDDTSVSLDPPKPNCRSWRALGCRRAVGLDIEALQLTDFSNISLIAQPWDRTIGGREHALRFFTRRRLRMGLRRQYRKE